MHIQWNITHPYKKNIQFATMWMELRGQHGTNTGHSLLDIRSIFYQENGILVISREL